MWIAYNPQQITGDALNLLKVRVEGKPYTMMSPYPGLDKPISLQSWGHQLKVDKADDARIDEFIAALRSNPNGVYPEVGASCDALGPGQFDPDNPPPFDPSKPGPDAKPMDYKGTPNAQADQQTGGMSRSAAVRPGVGHADQVSSPEQPTWSRWVIIGGTLLAVLLIGATAGMFLTRTIDGDSAAATPAAGSVEVGFAQDMSTHHLQAVTMAGWARDHSTDPEIRQLAFDIERTQLEQVGRMKGWLMLWDQPEQADRRADEVDDGADDRPRRHVDGHVVGQPGRGRPDAGHGDRRRS